MWSVRSKTWGTLLSENVTWADGMVTLSGPVTRNGAEFAPGYAFVPLTDVTLITPPVKINKEI